MFWTIQSTGQYENEEKHHMVWIREAVKKWYFFRNNSLTSGAPLPPWYV